MFEWLGPLTASLLVTSVIWGLRLEGRVNTTQQQIVDHKELNKERESGIKELINAKFDGTDARLDRIERAMNGRLGPHGRP